MEFCSIASVDFVCHMTSSLLIWKAIFIDGACNYSAVIFYYTHLHKDAKNKYVACVCVNDSNVQLLDC